MGEKYPYVSRVKISNRDGRRDGKIKSVQMTIYTQYHNDESHSISLKMEDRELSVGRHAKDYGSTLPGDMTKRIDDVTEARELAKEQARELNLDNPEMWDDE